MPKQSLVRFTAELSPDVAKYLDTLKGMSGRKSRNAVLEDLIRIVYHMIRIRATEADQKEMRKTILKLVEYQLEPYWEPYKQTTRR